MIPPPLLPAELGQVSARGRSNEEFGPGTFRPYLALTLAGAPEGLEEWLEQLPCPVIGVGAGPLASGCDVVLPDASDLPQIAVNIARAPYAAMILVQLLRAGRGLAEQHALTAESLGFATLQAGPEFKRWRQSYSPPPCGPADGKPPLAVSREGGALCLELNRPASFNAIDVAMRDALAEAFDLAIADPDITQITLTGRGRCFSVGGDVAEFGSATDPATAHWVRTLRLPARRLPSLRARLTARVQGAAIGAGLEIAAFASRLTATRNAWFQLPELKYGLIPGAGGTVSLPRRIGRQRTAYMALSMRRLPAATALKWGLIDAVE